MSGLTKEAFDEQVVDESSQYMLDDLQLAAELGKTLLERNKELEAALRRHQHVVEDKMQEIEYLTKQNGALREANDSRIKIYEQLEASIQDLERDKYKLALDYKGEKKIVKQLHSTIESLETKVEELNRTLIEERRQAEIDRRYIAEQKAAAVSSPDIVELTASPSPIEEQERQPKEQERQPKKQERQPVTIRDVEELQPNDEMYEELVRVMLLLEGTQKSFAQERDKVSEMEEQLMAITQENQALQKKLSQKTNNDEVKTVHQELSLLDELKQGQICTNCLRDLTDRRDEDSIISENDEDDRSLYNLIEASEAPKRYCSTLYIQARTCSTCTHSTKYLHELPVNLINLLLELWFMLIRKFTILKCIVILFPSTRLPDSTVDKRSQL